jgi:CrcB protein
MTPQHIIYVALGGAIGAVLRYWVSGLSLNTSIPWGTITANLIACFILGVVVTKYSDGDKSLYLLIAVGLCGGLSTFSTLIFELYSYYTKAALAQGFLYLGGSIVSGLMAFVLGNHTSKLF